MPVEIFYDDDTDLSIIQNRHVAVLGYGSQGHAHALSLRDSGVDVRVGLLEGSKSRGKAESEGLRVLTPAAACEEADLIMVLERGRIIEMGRHDDLLARPGGAYARLNALQLIGGRRTDSLLAGGISADVDDEKPAPKMSADV